jgi:hypothetical protein
MAGCWFLCPSKTVGKGNGKDGKTGNSKNARFAVKGCTGRLSNKRHARCQQLHFADQKSGKPQSEYKVQVCGVCMTSRIENGQIVSLHSGGNETMRETLIDALTRFWLQLLINTGSYSLKHISTL